MPAEITVDSFSNLSGDYIITYNHNADTFTVNFIDPVSHLAGFADPSVVFTASERGGRGIGDVVDTLTFGTNVITIYADLVYPYVTRSMSSGGGTGGGGTITGNLVINSVATTNETASGAADGTATVNATSSALPLQYSLNNTNWQSSNVFTGLAGGTHTGYVMDDNGYTAQASFSIVTTPAPPYTLMGTPAIGGSRWSALFNPIVFTYQGAPVTKYRTEITSGYDGAANVITADHTANLSGTCRADISKYLRTLLQPKDDFDYTTINYRDANISASYAVRFCSVSRDADNNEVLGPWVSAGNPYYVTYAAMQIGNPSGGNMKPYVTSPATGQAPPARFLNDFKNPRYYTDMPFDISFIYSELIAGYQLKLGGNGIDINGNITGALGELMLLNENGSVLLNADGSKMLIEKQAPGVLYSRLGVNRLVINQNIPANSIWLDVFLFYIDNAGNHVPVTESRRLLLDNSPCNGLPYEYIKWMGPSGGWMYYMFLKNQLHELATKNPVINEKYIFDYAAADSTQQQVSIEAQRAITVGVNDISADEAEALSTLLYAPKVYRLLNKAQNIWQGVIVDTRSVKMYNTYGGIGDFEVKLLLPEINTQRV